MNWPDVLFFFHSRCVGFVNISSRGNIRFFFADGKSIDEKYNIVEINRI